MSTDPLSPAELARADMRAAGLGEPTMTELVVALRGLPDGPERERLENVYWALAIEKYGEDLAHSYQEEYQWLRTHR